MRLIIIRHGDPDYVHDSLTERGWKEAEALSEKLVKTSVDAWYCSPLGRAKATASCTMKKVGEELTILPWLREFNHPVKKERLLRPEIENRIAWDWLPKDWVERKAFYDKEAWVREPELSIYDLETYHKEVTSSLDALLESYGYKREGNLYRAVEPNHKTIVFFCHFGVEAVLLGHLLNISPMNLWHGFVAAPSSVTILNTEERERGYAYWRTSCFGDTSHLYAKGLEPSFAARFCEVYGDKEE